MSIKSFIGLIASGVAVYFYIYKYVYLFCHLLQRISREKRATFTTNRAHISMRILSLTICKPFIYNRLIFFRREQMSYFYSQMSDILVVRACLHGSSRIISIRLSRAKVTIFHK